MNIHAHSSGHSHHHHANYGNTFIIGILLNSAFVVTEITYGVLANSLALLADAGHNAADVLGLCMAWGATLLARRRASERFTYGLQSASILAAVANSLILMVAVGAIALEAIQRLNSPEAPMPYTVMIVATMGVIVNSFTAWLFHSEASHDLNIGVVFTHMAVDATISLSVLISGAIILETGWLWIDPLMSLGIILVIILGTWRLLKQSVSLALHAVPGAIDIAKVKGYLSGLKGVREVHDLHVWAMSTTGVAMSAHLIMPEGHPGDAFILEITNELDELFHINHATLQIEIGDMDSQCHSGCEHD